MLDMMYLINKYIILYIRRWWELFKDFLKEGQGKEDLECKRVGGWVKILNFFFFSIASVIKFKQRFEENQRIGNMDIWGRGVLDSRNSQYCGIVKTVLGAPGWVERPVSL